MPQVCRIKLKYKDFELEVEGDKDFVETKTNDFPTVVEKVLSSPYSMRNLLPSKSLENSETEENIKPSTNKPTIQVGTFVNEKKFKSDSDLTLGLCYYLFGFQNTEQFTTDDVKSICKVARHKLPTNISQSFTENVRKGLIYDTQEKKGLLKLYSITKAGEDYIENYSSSEKLERKNIKKSIPKLNSSLLEVDLDTLNLPSYPKISELIKFKEQLLIIMKIYTDNASTEWFSVNDLLSVLKEKFKINTNTQQIRDALDSFKTNIDSRKNEQGIKVYKLMSGGINEAETIIAKYKKN